MISGYRGDVYKKVNAVSARLCIKICCISYCFLLQTNDPRLVIRASFCISFVL